MARGARYSALVGSRDIVLGLGFGLPALKSMARKECVMFCCQCNTSNSSQGIIVWGDWVGSLLVVTTAGVGFVMGSGEVVDWVGLCWTTIGTMLAAASANAFNQIMEVTTDAQMKRTMRRPLPSGRMGMSHAVAFAVTMGVSGVTLLAWKANTITAELGAANVLLYTLVYTPLKQMHPINTWVGAVVGAIPPLMG
jgi:protoheme IX farnesyltransferase